MTAPKPDPRGDMRRVMILLVGLLLAAGGTYWWLHAQKPAPGAPEQMPTAQGARGRRGTMPDIIPVLVAPAETRDVPIYLDGLGTVQASATVTVRAMVDGPLQEVRFKEGQDVRAGDVLARIDPRIYQAALDQAVAKKKQDEATLANARLDSARYAKLAATAYASAQQADQAPEGTLEVLGLAPRHHHAPWTKAGARPSRPAGAARSS